MAAAAIFVLHAPPPPVTAGRRGSAEPHLLWIDPNYTVRKSKIISSQDLRSGPRLPADEVIHVRQAGARRETSQKDPSRLIGRWNQSRHGSFVVEETVQRQPASCREPGREIKGNIKHNGPENMEQNQKIHNINQISETSL